MTLIYAINQLSLSIAVNELPLYVSNTPLTKIDNQLFDKNLQALSHYSNTPEKTQIWD